MLAKDGIAQLRLIVQHTSNHFTLKLELTDCGCTSSVCTRRQYISARLVLLAEQATEPRTPLEGGKEVGWAVGAGEKGHLKGAKPVPGPTMMIGVDRDLGSLKSGFLATYTGTLSPTCTTSLWQSCSMHTQQARHANLRCTECAELCRQLASGSLS